MKKIKLEKLDKEVRKLMDEKRYLHTQGVRYTAAALAMAHGQDMEKAQIAGLLHDSAKQLPDDRKLKLCQKYGIEISPIERKNLFLLHAKLGSCLAREKFGVDDQDILSSIRWHTTGRPEMTVMEQIIFIADYIEPLRNKSDILPVVRRLAYTDLDITCYLILKNTLDYLGDDPDAIDPMTAEACRFYQKINEKKMKTQ